MAWLEPLTGQSIWSVLAAPILWITHVWSNWAAELVQVSFSGSSNKIATGSDIAV